MLLPNKYLNYLYYNFGDPYFIIQKSNWFYLNIQNGAMKVYHIQAIRTKGHVFNIFQKFIFQIKR